MGLRHLVGKCRASMKQQVMWRAMSSTSNPTYLPPYRSEPSFYFIDEDRAAEYVASVKRNPRRLPCGPWRDDPRLNKDDPCILKQAKHVIRHYNKEHNLNLEFVSVLSACRWTTTNNLEVQACDPLAARVSLKLRAFCSQNKVDQIFPLHPVPFMKIIDETKEEEDIRNKRKAYVETLLYANVRNCPIINKRLGLKSEHGILWRDGSGYIVKVSLDDDILLAHAAFAINEHNDNEKKASRLIFLRVVGAWLERVGKNAVVYHIMLEALNGKVRRRFFAVVASKPILEDVELLDWVVADSPKAITI